MSLHFFSMKSDFQTKDLSCQRLKKNIPVKDKKGIVYIYCLNNGFIGNLLETFILEVRFKQNIYL